jgi:hypothetical protein
MPEAQRLLALRSIDIARKGLDITIHSPSYREGMKYGALLNMVLRLSCLTPQSAAVHYTHATATFAASFLLRLAQLLCVATLLALPPTNDFGTSPDDCDLDEIRAHVEELVTLLSEGT